MAELVLDVHLELDAQELTAEQDPVRAIAELSRHAAEAQCDERGATLRHPEPVEVHMRTALKPETAADVILVASRWVADGPGVG